ncbi:MAG TPA: hypothetical protein VFL57_09225, partial [Bryobacteraceae bacterium]|nr:hypothetical protein [Bryobacteraceae bacterium]
AAFGQSATPPLSGNWVDSQGNRLQVSETNDVVSLTSRGWSFETSAKHYKADLAMSGMRSGNEFTAVQASTIGTWVLKGRLAPNGSVRATLQVTGEEPFEFILVRDEERVERRLPATAERIVVRPARASIPIGRWIPVSVSVANADGTMIAPVQPVFVELSSQGGTPIPHRVRVTPDYPRAPAGIKAESAEVTLKATSPGLPTITLQAWGCVDSAVTALRMSTRRSDGVADGRDALPLIVKFVDANGAPSHNRARPKSLDWTITGALRRPVAQRDGVIADEPVGPDECVSVQEIVSDRPGKAVVTARFASLQEEITLHFHAPLSAAAVLWALFGGLLGGIASAVQNYRSASRWKTRRWAASIFTALVGALAMFLGWHYGLLSAWPNAPNGLGLALLAGMIGGWAGSRVLASFADSVLATDKKKAATAA